jgi:hypothetical protein
MNYDFEIVVPTDLNNPKISQRIKDFKKYGFLNIQDTKAHLTLLSDKEDSQNKWLSDGWPKELDIEILNCPKNHVAQKIYHYYESHIKKDFAKWYVRLDEDSINDLTGLKKNLETHFDYNRPYHIAARLLYDPYPLDQKILSGLGFSSWYRSSHIHHIYEGPAHEQEISVTSVAAMNMMLDNPICKKYFQIRKEFAEGFGDHGLCHALRMCKVYGTEIKFLSNESNLCQSSIFGGNKNHVHWIARDQNPKFINWMETFNSKTHPKFTNKTFLLGNEQKNIVKFYENNQIKLVVENIKDEDNHNTIGLWCVKDDLLVILYDFYHNLIVMNIDDLKFENVTLMEI